MKANITLSLIIFIASLFCGLLFVSHQAAAQCGGPSCPDDAQPGEGIAGIDFLTFRRAIVPCGRKCNDPNTTYDETCSCTLCHLLILAKNIFDLLLAWLIIVALIMLTSAGVLYILSSGNASVKEMAKTIVSRTLWGFGIFLLSWLIIRSVLIFGAYNRSRSSEFTIGNSEVWYEFTCETENSQF